MENNQTNDQPREEASRELPLHFRLMDIYLEQVEKSVPLFTTMMKDIHSVYITGTQTAIKAGKMLEERSKMNVGFYKGVSRSFEMVAPVITEAQLGVTRAMVDSACKSIRLMRKTITDSK